MQPWPRYDNSPSTPLKTAFLLPHHEERERETREREQRQSEPVTSLSHGENQKRTNPRFTTFSFFYWMAASHPERALQRVTALGIGRRGAEHGVWGKRHLDEGSCGGPLPHLPHKTVVINA